MQQSKKNFPKYLIPPALTKALSKKHKRNARDADNKIRKFSDMLKELRKVNRLNLAEFHYFEFLKLGLYLEQFQQMSDLKKFSLIATNIEKVNDANVLNKFKINISNINEDDPILRVSDTLKVSECTGKKRVFFLKVASIQRNHVVAIANRKFCSSHSLSRDYSVDLVFNDYNFRRGHAILTSENSESIMPYVFPHKHQRARSIPGEVNNNNRVWFNNKISENPEQRQAVLSICAKSSVPAPYILYGPPGTGKTATIVETVCQIWKDSEDHILICTPSNTACDVVTSRILDYVIPNYVCRIYSQYKDYSTIPTDIKKCCNYDYEGFATELDKYNFIVRRIIITTLSSSAKLILQDLKLKFSYIFIDEAGQATQPDALTPIELIKVTKSTKCQIVISGDPQQLGPCIRSKLAEPILGESILEKLLRHEPYKKHKWFGYDPSYITKLIRNYRSGSEIIHVSNKLFYDNELIAYGGKETHHFPILFHAVEGTEKKVGTSTSSYNQEEINVVLKYVHYFIKHKIEGKRFTKKDIGIVTPFSLQSFKLRKILQRRNLEDVDVGTVEIFQGQEKEIIIISTVRSKMFLHDKGQHIGFLSNPRRFNVALTRAKTILVVVGNPNVLQVDSSWRYFLRFCKEHDACRGDSFTLNENIHQMLLNLNLGITCKSSEDLFHRNLRLFDKDQYYKS